MASYIIKYLKYLYIYSFLLIDARDMKLLPFNSSRRDASNGGSFMPLWSLEAEQFYKTSKWHSNEYEKCWFVDIFQYRSPSIASIDIKLPPFDASRWDESNGGGLMFLRSLVAEQFHNNVFFGISTISTCRNSLILTGNFKFRNGFN